LHGLLKWEFLLIENKMNPVEWNKYREEMNAWHAEQQAKLRYRPEKLSPPWKHVSDEMPEEGRYVLVRLMKDNWGSKDQEGVYFKVCCLERGISMAERRKMAAGELPDPTEYYWSGDPALRHESRRSNSYKSGDEHGNNQMPYRWQAFGPDAYFGQEVDYWMEIPRS
jgi:hypothetical protein